MERSGFKPFPIVEPKRNRLRRAARITAGAVIGVAEIASFNYSGDPLFIPGFGYDLVMQSGCPQVTSETKQEVSRDLGGLKAEILESLSDDEFLDFVIEQGKEVGLTVVDGRPYKDLIQGLDNVDDVVRALNLFTQKMSFSFEIPESISLEDFYMGFSTVDKNSLDVDLFKNGAFSFIDSFRLIPSEVIKAGGVHSVKLVNVNLKPSDNEPTIQTKSYRGRYNPFTNIIYEDIEGFFFGDSHLMPHEFAHSLDKSYCGRAGFFRDLEFSTLNPIGEPYGNTKDRNDAIFATSYAGKNMLEDKADTISTFIEDPLVHNASSPVLEQKEQLLIARLESMVPGYSEYIARIFPRISG